MEPLGSFARGLVVGFAIAAAIGPIGLLCIRRTMRDGFAVGLASGLGAATADGLYATVAALGLTAVADALVAGRRPLGAAGGAFLVLLAIRAFRYRRDRSAVDAARRHLLGAYGTTLALTIANPATILSFAAAFVGLGLIGHPGPAAATLAAGVWCGSAAWWTVLATGIAALRPRVGPTALRRLEVASSLLIGALGALAIVASLAAP